MACCGEAGAAVKRQVGYPGLGLSFLFGFFFGLSGQGLVLRSFRPFLVFVCRLAGQVGASAVRPLARRVRKVQVWRGRARPEALQQQGETTEHQVLLEEAMPTRREWT